MRDHSSIQTTLAAFAVGLTIWGWAPQCLRADQDKGIPPKQQERMEVMRAKGVGASLTVFPVAIWSTNEGEKGVEGIGKDVAKVVGVLLEKAGMENLAMADSAFVLPVDVEFDKVAERFGEFVRTNPIKTDYALYAEVVGRTGDPPQFDEIRGVIVDKAGDCVWVDRQTPDDPDFKRIKPSCLMTSSVLLTERVRTQLDIPDSERSDSGDGKLARMFAKESGTPDEAEWKAMEDRQAVLKKAGANAKVAVFPVRLSDEKVSKESAAHLAKLLGKTKLRGAKAVDAPLRVEIEPAPSEQKLLWSLARSFQDYLRQNPPEADYAVLADYTIRPRDGRVWTVHFVVCDRDGEWVIVDFQNDHHGDFQSIDPKTPEDCDRLVAKRLEGYLR